MGEPGEDAPLPGEERPAAEGAASASPAAASRVAGAKAASAERLQMPALENASGNPAAGDNLDVILDIPVTLAMELGRARIPIRTLMQLNQGSVVELERMAGEPLDILVNGMLIAHGEVVVINERFGIRFTDVVSPAERAQTLR
jgi:flagellar motor switch protein FliN/FliY